MRENLEKYKQIALIWFQKLSLREKVLVSLPACMLLLFIVFSLIFTPIRQAFSRQKEALEKSQSNVKIVAVMLDRYTKLKAKRAEIEEQYKEIEIKESGTTLLERLVHDKFNLPPGQFNIKDGSPQKFGVDYEKTPYTVKFSTADMAQLVSFLDELTHGKTPMVLRRLDIKKRGSSVLDVELDVSGIRKQEG